MRFVDNTAPSTTDLSRQIEMIERLVSFPTISSESNLDLIDWIETYLFGLGVQSTRIYNDERTKANLYAVIGPQSGGGVVLSGHTDVVPVDGQSWSSNPFAVDLRNGRLHGRGTADMKSFLAIALSLVPEMLTADLTRPVILALSYDEELGCLGAPRMIDDMVTTIPTPQAVIVGEPTGMAVVTGHKGCFTMNTRVTGHSVHASLIDQGVSAVVTAARLICWLDDQMAENRARARSDSPFDPPYTSLHSGMVSGGTAHNITAKSCSITSDIRTIPGEIALEYLARYRHHIETEIEPEMHVIASDSGVEIDITADVPPLKPETDGAAEQLARRLTGDNGTHVVGFGTEGGQFQNAGFSTVVCGPGSIDQAHKPNEFIEMRQVEAATQFLRDLLTHLSR